MFDYVETLHEVARLCSPILGDCCGIYLRDDDDAVSLVVGHHVDKKRELLARQILGRFAVNANASVHCRGGLRAHGVEPLHVDTISAIIGAK